MKHTLQWKIVGIMFISLFCGVTCMAISQYIFFDAIMGITAEEAEVAFADYSYLFNIEFLLVTILTFLLLSRRIMKRIEIMNSNVAQIAKGQMQELTEDQRQDELGSLSRNINCMAETISNSLEKERMMLCNVAHDLRTPVTSIQGYARLLMKSAKLTEEDKKYAEIIEDKSINLKEQIEELLEYSVLQFEEKEYQFENLSLKRIAEQVIIEFVPLMEQKQMTFSISGNDHELEFSCNRILIVRLLENLINNSIRYGAYNSKIEVLLEETNEEIKFAVSNYGQTMPPEERKHLFEVFYQGKEAKEYHTDSKGLGLAISKKIVSIHKGTIQVECDEALQKTTFTVRFPIQKY